MTEAIIPDTAVQAAAEALNNNSILQPPACRVYARIALEAAGLSELVAEVERQRAEILQLNEWSDKDAELEDKLTARVATLEALLRECRPSASGSTRTRIDAALATDPSQPKETVK